MDDAEADKLRQLVSQVQQDVEAHIRGVVGAGENVRRSTQQVQIAAMGPPKYWAMQVYQPLNNTCLIMAQEMGLLPLINEEEGPVTARSLSANSGQEELLIARIMRVLTAVGIVEEVGVNTYRSNEVSKIAASLGGKAVIKHNNELLFRIVVQLVPYMREHGFKQFPKRPEEQDLPQFTFGGKTMWEYFKENPEEKHWFDALMAASRRNDLPMFKIYPLADEIGHACADNPDRALLVDVGGNRGADMIEFRKTFPELPGRLILQDLPETIDAIDRSTTSGIELQAYDFFTPQPVKGAKVYFWRRILHDWDDENIREFVSNTVQAMAPDSRMLIQELVLPDVGVDMKRSHLDILMMLYHSGMERTLSQWSSLMDSCGLEIAKVWSRPDTDPSVLECRLKGSK